MTLYVETSSILGWLLNEPAATQVEAALRQAAVQVTSELTLAESGRALTRLAALGLASPADVGARQQRLDALRLSWHILPVSSSILGAVRTQFPVEPVRTLDAIHLCTILECRAPFPGLSVLSLDQRVRSNAQALGFPLRP